MTLPPVDVACSPPAPDRAALVDPQELYLRARERKGVPCFRCIANEAGPGEPARCGMLRRDRRPATWRTPTP